MDARRGLFGDVALAATVLTRLPLAAGPPERGEIAAASWAFPLVGAGIGIAAGCVFLVAEMLGCGANAAAWLAVLSVVLLTGALHEDGLADTADGFGGGHDPAQKLAIMRDSRHGTYGILALVISVGLRVTCIAAIGEPIHAGLALFAAHAASRGFLPVTMLLLRPAREDGLGALAGTPSLLTALAAAATGVVIAVAALGPLPGAAALLLAALAVAATATLARRQIGGYTGDVLGTFQQVGEIVMLLVAAAK